MYTEMNIDDAVSVWRRLGRPDRLLISDLLTPMCVHFVIPYQFRPSVIS